MRISAFSAWSAQTTQDAPRIQSKGSTKDFLLSVHHKYSSNYRSIFSPPIHRSLVLNWSTIKVLSVPPLSSRDFCSQAHVICQRIVSHKRRAIAEELPSAEESNLYYMVLTRHLSPFDTVGIPICLLRCGPCDGCRVFGIVCLFLAPEFSLFNVAELYSTSYKTSSQQGQ